MMIVTSETQWTPITSTIHARIWNGRVWRKELSPAYFGGYQIKSVGMDTKLGREWLAAFGHSHATCSKDVVDFIDPTGALRRAGLLSVAKESTNA
jgi:hypothetical protein